MRTLTTITATLGVVGAIVVGSAVPAAAWYGGYYPYHQRHYYAYYPYYHHYWHRWHHWYERAVFHRCYRCSGERGLILLLRSANLACERSSFVVLSRADRREPQG